MQSCYWTSGEPRNDIACTYVRVIDYTIWGESVHHLEVDPYNDFYTLSTVRLGLKPEAKNVTPLSVFQVNKAYLTNNGLVRAIYNLAKERDFVGMMRTWRAKLPSFEDLEKKLNRLPSETASTFKSPGTSLQGGLSKRKAVY